MKGNSMRAISGKRGAAWLLVFFLAALFSLAVGVTTAAQDQTEVQQLKSMVESLQKTVQQLNQRIAVLEQEKTAAPQQPAAQQPVPAPQAQQVQPETPTIPEGHASPVTLRDSFSNEQAAAPRLNDLTVDPKYQGFIRIPNSPVIMQFNAKPHLDMMEDDRNTGDKSRFVTALIPV